MAERTSFTSAQSLTLAPVVEETRLAKRKIEEKRFIIFAVCEVGCCACV